ncbi:GD21033 [Drosophila simulans]|uniref:glutathione-specific gamma-glutamylcyclotransferase n=1 Tax=Drosophila simulans TaxID=7240 RepID=B4R238_DROSI|nr:GD21033 [Drosophila simulans]
MAHFSGHRQPAAVPSHFKDLFTNGQLGAAEESNNNDQNEQENRPSNNNNAGPSEPACWVFGYGSLCWHPGFNYTKCITGYIRGYVRRFWQGNVTHRGCEEKPGRVATLVEDKEGITWGCAYRITGSTALDYLKQRECPWVSIAGLFTVFSSFIFTTAIIKFLGSDISELKDALFFLLLVIDLSNSGRLAQLALSGSNQAEVTQNIARGLELLGPAISLDTIVEVLLVGVGTLSGVQRLEVLCMFAVLSVLVNYVVFMTFYPACLSLIFDLSRSGVDMSVVREKAKGSLLLKSLTEEEQKANPVLQRVKLIMTTGLMAVHIYSRVAFSGSDYDAVDKTLTPTLSLNVSNNRTESGEIADIIIKWLTMSADHIVISIVLIALVVKFICFDNRDPLPDQLRQSGPVAIAAKASQTTPIDEEHVEQERDTEISPVARPLLFTIEDQSSVNASTQTDLLPLRHRLVGPTRPPRPIQECLDILNSTEEGSGPASLSDEEILSIVHAGGTHCPLHRIESVLNDPERGVRIRRMIISGRAKMPVGRLDVLPYEHFDYRKMLNACC